MRIKIACLLFLWFFFNATVFSQDKKQIQKPKLIIGIIIDQMRYDFIYRLWDKFDNNGFKRLINEGAFCKNAKYNYPITKYIISYATIATGSNPSMHGIISEDWYAPLYNRVINCIKDSTVSTLGGYYESGKYSPVKLLSSTITDELKISNKKKSKVISISMDPGPAVLSAGLIGNAAYWFDTETSNWITSSYYMKDIPLWITEFNRKKLPDVYLDRNWETLLPIQEYGDSTMDAGKYETGFHGLKVFPYDLKKLSSGHDKKNYALLKTTPFANTLVKDFAISAIVNEQLGKDDFTDMLYISFSSTEYINQSFGLNSVEMEDAYLRLDRDIKHLLDFIDGYLGKGNVLIFLTSSHGSSYNPQYLTDMGISKSFFNSSQAMALLKSYLNATYGTGDRIKHNSNLQIYLNDDLIKKSKLSTEAFQNDVVEFMMQFTGVVNVLSGKTIQNSSFSGDIFKKVQNLYNQKRSGDIVIILEPGCLEKKGLDINYSSPYNDDTHVPLIWYGWKIKNQTISRKIDMTDIAPTLSQILDISIPNACQGEPIMELFEK